MKNRNDEFKIKVGKFTAEGYGESFTITEQYDHETEYKIHCFNNTYHQDLKDLKTLIDTLSKLLPHNFIPIDEGGAI